VYQEEIADGPNNEKRWRVMFSIDFPDSKLNEHAQKTKVETTLSLIGVKYFVKAPFSKKMIYSFNCFDADEELEAMEECLG